MDDNYIKKAVKIVKGTFIVWLFMIITSLTITFITNLFIGELNYYSELNLRGLGLLLAGLFISYYISKKDPYLFNKFSSTVPFSLENFRLFFRTLLLTLLALYTFFFIGGLFNTHTLIHWGTEYFNSHRLTKHVLIVVLLTFPLGIIGEEILFRGYLLNYFNSFLRNRILAILVSAVIFALGHLHYTDISNFLLAIAGGIVTGYGYLKFQSFFVPIAIHYSYNLFNFTIASNSGHELQLPYIVKMNYLRIGEGLGTWTEMFILLGFISIFLALLFAESEDQQHVYF